MPFSPSGWLLPVRSVSELSAQFKTGPLSADVVGSHLFTRTLLCCAGCATDVPTNKSLKSLRTVAIAPLKSRHASRNRERIREKLRLRRECRETCVDAELRCDKCFRFQPGEQNNRSSTSDSDAIRYIGIISGKETCEFWACRKSKQFLTFRCRIRSSSDWLGLSVESAWISRCSGQRLIWS